MIKMTGAEFWEFYNDPKFWPEGVWHDDEVMTVNGAVVSDYSTETILPDSQVTIDGGVIFLDEEGEESRSFEGHIKKWRKSCTVAYFTVEAPKDKLDAIKTAIKAAGGKIT